LPSRHLPPATLAAYGGPSFAVAYLLFFLQFYFLKFATDVLLLAPGVVGALFALAKLWDGINGPLVGSWSDRTRSRFGRRRPFLLGSLPFLGLGFAMLWIVPAGLEGPWLIAWIATALFVFYTAFDLYTLPHMALGAELSSDSHQRTRLFAVRHMSFTVGILLAFGAIQVAMNAADARAAAARLAVPSALAAVALLVVTPLTLREPGGAAGRGGRSLLAGLRDVLATRASRLLLAVQLIEATGVGAVGTMAPYVAEYLLGRPEVVGLLPAAYVVAGVLSIPVWVRISRSYGRRETWLAAMLLAAVSFGAMWTVSADDLALLMALLVVAGAAMGCGGVLGNALLADVIDLDEQRTGERKEGVYSAGMTLALKVGTALSVAASGFALSAAGFVPNVAQSETSLLGIRFLFAGMPCIGFLLGAWLFRGFSLEAPAPLAPRPAPGGVTTAPPAR
jgi:GPH family glycoside/pentoside/hexuronide:cation symporter